MLPLMDYEAKLNHFGYTAKDNATFLVSINTF